jgi:hypothetical protein
VYLAVLPVSSADYLSGKKLIKRKAVPFDDGFICNFIAFSKLKTIAPGRFVKLPSIKEGARGFLLYTFTNGLSAF